MALSEESHDPGAHSRAIRNFYRCYQNIKKIRAINCTLYYSIQKQISNQIFTKICSNYAFLVVKQPVFRFP